ncbi:MAG: glycosyltransferase family 39 protein [Verrucomicrobia bacterium]|nr:glycosyltransferase family 39 protein [Verrucomicrobiota bacterium]
MQSPMKLSPRLVPWMLVAVALAVLLPGTATIPLIDRDEPRFAQAAREMMEGENANWIVPYFNGQYRFDKPILIYWMMRASYAVFGVNEFSARLPSVLCAIALALFLWCVGRRWFSEEAGVLAGLGIVTCVQVLMHGRSAVADMPMVLAIAVAQVAMFELLQGGVVAAVPGGVVSPPAAGTAASTSKFWMLYLALGLGFLAKGPVALVVPALTLVFYRFVFWRRPLPWRNLKLALGIPITLLTMAAWGIPAMIATKGLFFRIGIGEHVLQRGYKTFQGHGGFILYYIVTAFVSLCPWIACAGEGAVAVKRNWNAKTAFLVSWLAATYLVFSLYVTKLPHYVLPAFPAFFLLLGLLGQPSEQPRWARVFFWVIAGVFTVMGLVFLPLLGLVLLLLAARLSRPALAVAGIVIVAVGTAFGAAKLRPHTATIQLLPIFRQMPAETECAGFLFVEPGLVFYSNHRWNMLGDTAELSAWMTNAGPRLVVCTEREWQLGGPKQNWKRIFDYSGELASLPTNGYRQTTVEGLNITCGSWVRLRVYQRWD